uniref:Uncharacterized protein n=1 Tax=Setaria italica TaxID=4555 RepID=K4AN43_SETIT
MDLNKWGEPGDPPGRAYTIYACRSVGLIVYLRLR